MICEMLSYILGQPAYTIPRDRPIHEIADSINVLRLTATVSQKTNGHLGSDEVLDAKNVQDLAQRLERVRVMSASDAAAVTEVRIGPPTAAEMIYTHGDESRAAQTRRVTAPILQ